MNTSDGAHSAFSVLQNHDLLRFITCGSVDDGKSTLIGRLLYDCRAVPDDQLAKLEKDSLRYGATGGEPDFSLLVDGLDAEREQGITIDVAYRYFSTQKRSFIVADTPGHEQYTRNMATGASNAQLAVILVDARKGILDQTKRHSLICSFMGIRHVLLAINKIDLVDYRSDVFNKIVEEYSRYASELEFASIAFIPLSARYGDNVTKSSDKLPWYDGPTLLSHLENCQLEGPSSDGPLRYPIQLVSRMPTGERCYCGTMAGGHLRVGDDVCIAGSGQTATVSTIATFDGSRQDARSGDAIAITLTREIDLSRGDVLISPSSTMEYSDQFSASVVWFNEEPLIPGRSYFARMGTQSASISVTRLKHKIDVHTRQKIPATSIEMNDIAVCNFATSRSVAFDPFKSNKRTGCFILVDRLTNATAGAGMIAFGLRRAKNIVASDGMLTELDRSTIKYQKPIVVWFTGLPGSGKTTIANALERRLHDHRCHTMMLDGDSFRKGMSRDLGFTEADRVENIRRAGETAKLMIEAGLVILCSFVSPYRADRQMVRDLMGAGKFIEVFVDTPIEECIRRDPKGHYARAGRGELKNLTGVGAPYEAPVSPEIRLSTLDADVEMSVDVLWAELKNLGVIR